MKDEEGEEIGLLAAIGNMDWEYAGEGGAHVIFSYQAREEEPATIIHHHKNENDNDDDDDDDKHAGCSSSLLTSHTLLRLVKQDLVACWHQQSHANNHETTTAATSNVRQQDYNVLIPTHTDGKNSGTPTTTKELWYLSHVIAPSLDPYVDVPQSVWVPTSLARALYAQASEKIPSHRKDSWRFTVPDQMKATAIGKNQKTLSCPSFLRGLLMRDYRLPLLLSQSSTTSTTSTKAVPNTTIRPERRVLSIEIKPKAGYTATAPLVDVDRQHIKYYQCRYQYVHGTVSKHDSNTTVTTMYNPMDLFPQKEKNNENGPQLARSRVRRALQALIDQPRNNFSCWLTTSSTTTTSTTTKGGAFRDLVSQWHVTASTSDWVLDLVSVLLVDAEPMFLRRIVALQRLDVIDSDGAVRMYDILVHKWLQGCHERAWELLDGDCSHVHGDGVGDDQTAAQGMPHERLKACPPALLVVPDGLGPPSRAIREYLDLVVRLEQILEKQQPFTQVSNAILELHDQAVQIVEERMNSTDCILLLRLWLLSLAMCDLSFFVSLEILDDDNPQRHVLGNETPPNLNPGEFRPHSHQTSQTPGVLWYNYQGSTFAVQYEIKTIDCDRKPAKKVKARRKKENLAFANISSSTKQNVCNPKNV